MNREMEGNSWPWAPLHHTGIPLHFVQFEVVCIGYGGTRSWTQLMGLLLDPALAILVASMEVPRAVMKNARRAWSGRATSLVLVFRFITTTYLIKATVVVLAHLLCVENRR